MFCFDRPIHPPSRLTRDPTRSDDDDDDEEEDSKEALMDMLENAHTCLEMKRKKCKELRKELKALKRSFDELNASH